MTSRKLWTLSMAGVATSMLLAANPVLAHYADRGGPDHFRGHAWHHSYYYYPRPALIVAPRPAFVPRPVFVAPPVVSYAYPPPPVYYGPVAPAPVALGTLGGAVAGAALGSTLGQGNGRTAAIAIGSAVGAVVGSQAVPLR